MTLLAGCRDLGEVLVCHRDPGACDLWEETEEPFFIYVLLSCESGLASFVARVWNPADSLLLAPPETEFLLGRALPDSVQCTEPLSLGQK